MTRHSHPNATKIKPYQQGDLDCLCGLYSLINAARLLYAEVNPLTGQRCKRLFVEGMDFVNTKKNSRDAAAIWGMTVARQRKLAKALFEGEALAGLPPLRLGPQLPQIVKVEDLEAAIEEALDDGAILLVCFHGRISHHSLIVGHKTTRLELFDSDGMKFVKKSSLRFDDLQKGTLKFYAAASLGFD